MFELEAAEDVYEMADTVLSAATHSSILLIVFLHPMMR